MSINHHFEVAEKKFSQWNIKKCQKIVKNADHSFVEPNVMSANVSWNGEKQQILTLSSWNKWIFDIYFSIIF